MNCKQILSLTFYTSIALLLISNTTSAADWPMWRCDTSRTACSTEELAPELHLQWTLELPEPKSCWPFTQYKLLFDLSYEPIVMGNTLYIPSMARDSVSAYDIRNGELKWRFYADGPVRFAPVGWNKKIYFVSDDGYLYCLNADNGSLLWKFRGGPSDRKVLGNERLVSMWPARGAPVIYDGTVYFAASIWPFMGTFIYAIDAETGDVVWCNSGSGSDYILQPHSSPSFAGVAPQGYLVATKDKILVAGSRSVPAAYDRKTGQTLYYHANTKFGGYGVFASENAFFNGGVMYNLVDGNPFARSNACLVSGNLAISMEPDGSILAAPMVPEWQEYKDKRGETQKRAVFPPVWQIGKDIPKPIEKIFIQSGKRFYGGAPGIVAAMEIPSANGEQATQPEKLFSWKTEIEGQPWSMLSANGRLFVVTQEGRIYCFGEKQVQPKMHRLIRVAQAFGQDDSDAQQSWTQKTHEILETTGIRDGYCLILGIGSGRLIEELIRQTNLHVIGLDPDTRKIDALRRRFDERGIYGERMALIPGDINTIPLPQYVANLVLSEDLQASGIENTAQFTKRAFHILRPYGGTACFELDDNTKTLFTGAVQANSLPRAEVTDKGEYTLLVREGSLPGSDDWTHQYGNVANTVSSDDDLVKPPLGLLWFGGPSHLDVLPRHGHGPPQQIMDGRLFIQGIQVLSARDVYTGRILWRKEIPELNTFEMYYNDSYNPDIYDLSYNQRHIPGANQYGTNFIVTKDLIYLVMSKDCLLIDPTNGETLDKWQLPEQPEIGTPNWGYIGVYEDLLIACAAPFRIEEDKEQQIVQANNRFGKGSQYLFVMDRHTGDILWQKKAAYNFRHNTIVAGNGKLFCMDSMSMPRMDILKRRGLKFDNKATIQAYDIRTGDPLWTVAENVFGTWLAYSVEHDALLQAGSDSGDRARDEIGKGMTVYRGSNGDVLWQNDEDYNGPCILIHGQIITQTGGSNQHAPPAKAFDLLTGERILAHHPLTGDENPWAWVRFKGCNTAIGSDHLLTFRSASAAFVNLSESQGTKTIGGFRSGCTSNLVAADGVLNAPDYTRTCTCAYQNQTSLALVHMPADDPDSPAIEEWSFDFFPGPEKPVPVKQLGINFGAPGDRYDDTGTFWLEFPSVGGPSPDIPVDIHAEEPKLFRQHSSKMIIDRTSSENNVPAWIAASGIEGESVISIHPFLQPVSPDANRDVQGFERHAATKDLITGVSTAKGRFDYTKTYSLKLYFAEKDDLKTGDRIFDIYVQGKPVLKDFDIAKEAGGAGRPIAVDIGSIGVTENIDIELKASDPNSPHKPLICGIEFHSLD